MSKEGIGKDYIVQLGVGTDDKNSSWRAIFLDQPSLGLSREYLIKGFDDSDVQHYFTYMKDVAELMGADKNLAAKDLEKSLKFELELAALSAPREERRNASKLYNPVILKDFPELPGHPPNWADYVNSVIFDNDITENDRIIVSNPAYIANVSKVLSETEPRVIANYLGWRVAKASVSFLNMAARDIKQKYVKAIEGKASQPARWKTCVEAVGFNSYNAANFR